MGLEMEGVVPFGEKPVWVYELPLRLSLSPSFIREDDSMLLQCKEIRRLRILSRYRRRSNANNTGSQQSKVCLHGSYSFCFSAVLDNNGIQLTENI